MIATAQFVMEVIGLVLALSGGLARVITWYVCLEIESGLNKLHLNIIQEMQASYVLRTEWDMGR